MNALIPRTLHMTHASRWYTSDTPSHTHSHTHTHTHTHAIDISAFAPPWLCDSIHCESQVLLKEASGPTQLDTCGSLQCRVERLWTALPTIAVLHSGPLRSIWLASSLHQMPLSIAVSPRGYTLCYLLCHLLCVCVCCVYIEVRIQFWASECSLPYF